jgi:hypothetical protein
VCIRGNDRRIRRHLGDLRLAVGAGNRHGLHASRTHHEQNKRDTDEASHEAPEMTVPEG